MSKVLILNGPNLSRLGSREPDVYGSASYNDLVSACSSTAVELGLEADVRQTNDEAELIAWIHEAVDTKTHVILNPAAFTHYSYAIRDAAELVKNVLIEVHLSNPMAREEFRHTSVISGVANGTIAGFGPNSYVLALIALKSLLAN